MVKKSDLKVPIILKLTTGRFSSYLVGGITFLGLALGWFFIYKINNISDLSNAWRVPTFFSVTIAYALIIVKVIVNGHIKDFESISHKSKLSNEELNQLKLQFTHHKRLRIESIISVGVALVHSYLSSGSLQRIFTGNFSNLFIDLWMNFVMILIWISITNASSIFVSNLKVFSYLAKNVEVDILRTESLVPFVKAGVRSTLGFIGAYALFPLLGFPSFKEMLFNPAIIIFIPIIIVMILIPILPLKKQIKQAKLKELSLIDQAIDGNMGVLTESRINGQYAQLNVIDLINYKKIILGIKEIPINIPVAFRMIFYILIPLLTWIAASLVDKLVVAIINS